MNLDILHLSIVFAGIQWKFCCDFFHADIDECETGFHNCGPEFVCQNTQGSFRCLPKVKCGVGYIQDALGNCIGKSTVEVS